MISTTVDSAPAAVSRNTSAVLSNLVTFHQSSAVSTTAEAKEFESCFNCLIMSWYVLACLGSLLFPIGHQIYLAEHGQDIWMKFLAPS